MSKRIGCSILVLLCYTLATGCGKKIEVNCDDGMGAMLIKHLLPVEEVCHLVMEDDHCNNRRRELPEQSGPQKEVCKTILEERCDKVLEEVPEQVCEKIPVRDCSGPAPNYRSADGSGVTLLELKEKCGQNTSDLTPSCSEVLEEECRTIIDIEPEVRCWRRTTRYECQDQVRLEGQERAVAASVSASASEAEVEVCQPEAVEICTEPIIDFYKFVPGKCERVTRQRCHKVKKQAESRRDCQPTPEECIIFEKPVERQECQKRPKRRCDPPIARSKECEHFVKNLLIKRPAKCKHSFEQQCRTTFKMVERQRCLEYPKKTCRKVPMKSSRRHDSDIDQPCKPKARKVCQRVPMLNPSVLQQLLGSFMECEGRQDPDRSNFHHRSLTQKEEDDFHFTPIIS